MEVCEAICVENYQIVGADGEGMVLLRGHEYTISPPEDSEDTVIVFSRYWCRVPKSIFAGVITLKEKIRRGQEEYARKYPKQSDAGEKRG